MVSIASPRKRQIIWMQRPHVAPVDTLGMTAQALRNAA